MPGKPGAGRDGVVMASLITPEPGLCNAPPRGPDPGSRASLTGGGVASITGPDCRREGFMQFELSEDQRAFQEMARNFAAQELQPHAADWDRNHFFPVETLRKAAALGLAGIYVREDVGGSALTRLDAALVFEALSAGCTSTAAFLSIHNMA